MTFLESRLSTRITRGATRKVRQPGRTKTYTPNGALRQNFTASLPKHTFSIGHGLMDCGDVARSYHTVLDLFYLVMFTPYVGFRLRDEADYKATALNSSATLVTGSTYQLNRKHTFGGQTFMRPIYKPVNNVALAVFNAGGTPLTPTVDYTDGTFTVASGTPAYWTGEFDLPVTFVEDEWSADIEIGGERGAVVLGDIEVEEIVLL